MAEADKIVSQEFKKPGSRVVLLRADRDTEELPDFERLHSIYSKLCELTQKGLVLSSGAIKFGGVAAAVSKMCFGNKLGFTFNESFEEKKLFKPDYGSIIVELESTHDLKTLFGDTAFEIIGSTKSEQSITIRGVEIELEEALQAWKSPLERIFPVSMKEMEEKPENINYNSVKIVRSSARVAKPRVFIPVFPGTNCEYDTAKAFEKAGAITEQLVFRNITPSDIEASIKGMVKSISSSQIIALPGGFSAGDEPDGSGKFIAAVFRNPEVSEAVMKLLNERDGLMLGICNGFQALIKLGLLPYGEIREIDESSPTLTYNTIGRHVSGMVRTKVVSTLSPWFGKSKVGDIHTIAVSHGEGRFAANKDVVAELIKNGQVSTQYVNLMDDPAYDGVFNPNGSIVAIEGITSPDGRILGKMGHSERTGENIAKNIPGNKDQKIFAAGVEYFSL
jgi:phosphoribosylformylglycinamidine synthase